MERRVRGRDSELELFGEFIGTPGGVLLLEGPAGIGKTRLLTEAKEIARRSGVRVAAAEAFEGQRTVPFATLLSALLEGSDPVWSAEGLEHLRRESDFSYWIIEELQDVLERAALEGPLLVALDDLHFADAGTLVALRTLVSRTAELPIAWVFALRPGESRAELRELLQRLEHARRLELGPLCDDAVAAVVADRLDAPGEPALLQLAATARGNAFLLVELLEGLREEGRVTIVDERAHVRGGELPARLAESMRDRLDRLGNDACQVVRVAAVLGQRFTAEELAAVLHSRPSQLLEPIDEAVRADMLSESRDRLSFRHELLRQAVLGTLPLSVRRSLQREVATALIEHGASAVHVAAQVAESAMPGDEWAVEHLRAAARELSPTDAEAAADMSVRALELSPANSSTRGALLIETLAFLHGALRDDEAEALAAEALEGALTTEEQAEVRLSLSTRLSRPELQRAEENRGALQLPGLSPRMRARHHGWLAYSLANAGLIDEAQEHAEDALATAGTDDEPARALAILALSTVAMRRGEYTAALAQLDEVDAAAAAAEGPLVPCLTELRRAEALGMLGRLDEAAVLLRDNLERQRRERRTCLEGAWLAMGSHLRFMAGALEDAVENAEAAETLGFPFSATPGGAGAMLARLQVALHTGDSKRRRAALTTAHRTHADGGPAAHWDASWVFALASGDTRQAVGRLDAEAQLVPRDPAFLPHLARLALAEGHRALASRAAAVAIGVAQANPGVRLLAGLAAHTRGLVDRDARELVRAAELLEGTQRPLAQASALEDAGRVIGDVNRLSAAFELYSSIGATVDAKRTASRLREHGVRLRVTRPAPAEGWDSLTESELRVVRLVGSGASNRRAAERLYLSPHTVSTHLRHAFVKLQINSRVELARFLHEHDVPALAP